MEIKVDEDRVDTDEAIAEEESNEQETIEKPEVSEESEPAEIQEEDEEEDRIVTIGDAPAEGEADEDAEHQETPGWVKKVRKSNRRLESENKRLKRELDESKTETVKPVELGEEPTLKSCNYDDKEYGQKLKEYFVREKKVEEQAAQEAKTVEEQNKNWQVRQDKYVSLRQEHSFKDFGEAEELVSTTFSNKQQSIIVQGADDSALLVYALGKNPKKLEELAKITNPIDFAFAVAKVETKLKQTSRKAPKPETRVPTGGAGGTSGNGDKTLERLREKAAKTGDMTEVVAYKKKLRDKG